MHEAVEKDIAKSRQRMHLAEKIKAPQSLKITEEGSATDRDELCVAFGAWKAFAEPAVVHTPEQVKELSAKWDARPDEFVSTRLTNLWVMSDEDFQASFERADKGGGSEPDGDEWDRESNNPGEEDKDEQQRDPDTGEIYGEIYDADRDDVSNKLDEFDKIIQSVDSVSISAHQVCCCRWNCCNQPNPVITRIDTTPTNGETTVFYDTPVEVYQCTACGDVCDIVAEVSDL